MSIVYTLEKIHFNFISMLRLALVRKRICSYMITGWKAEKFADIA